MTIISTPAIRHPYLAIYVSLLLLLLMANGAAGAPKPHLSHAQFRFKIIEAPELNVVGYHNDIAQDATGFTWLAGSNGMVRYDGYSFRLYQHQPDQQNSISHGNIRKVIATTDGELWLITYEGLSRYNPKTDDFTRYLPPTGGNPVNIENYSYSYALQIAENTLLLAKSLDGLQLFNTKSKTFTPLSKLNEVISQSSIRVVNEAPNGNFWVGTEKHGLYQVDIEQQTIVRHIRFQSDYRISKKHLSSNNVYSVHQSDRNILWVGTSSGGLNRVDLTSGEVQHFLHNPDNEGSISNNIVWAINSDAEGNLWVGTDKGLNVLRTDAETGKHYFEHFLARHSDPGGQHFDSIRSLYRDKNNYLWVGLYPAGVALLDPYASGFKVFRHQQYNTNSINHNAILSVAESNDGGLWIGTELGLNYLDADRKNVVRYQHDTNDPDSLSAKAVLSVIEDHQGTVWAGTWRGGLNRLDRSTGKFKHYLSNSTQADSLHDGEVWSLYEDHLNRLWLGTYDDGIQRYLPETDNFITYALDDLADNGSYGRIMSIFEDRQHRLWFGASSGLYVLLPGSDQVKHASELIPLKGIRDQRFVSGMFQDQQGYIWFGSRGDGITRFNTNPPSVEAFWVKHGLSDNSVTGIMQAKANLSKEGQQANLWIATHNGLSRFNPNTHEVKNYHQSHGLAGSSHSKVASLITSHGELVLGSTKGLTIFKPKDLHSNPLAPPIVFTDFKIAGQSVDIRQADSPLKQSISHADSITLGHEHTVFSFAYAALSYHLPEETIYAYRLVGFDENWNFVGKRRLATYTNLDPGHYTFKVKAANSEGTWNEKGISIDIKILPPWWLNNWAKVTYALLFSALLWLIIYTYLQKRRVESERKLNLRLRQVDKIKDTFLANTSHELRTPLNGIIGLSESLMEGVSGELPQAANDNLKLIIDSGKRLAHLVNDILDFSKLKEDTLVLHCKPVDVYSIVDLVLSLSATLIKQKPVTLSSSVSQNLPRVWADENRLQQILYNLVGNAIKFTLEGEVTVDAKVSGHMLWLKVSDTGIGIAKHQQEKIFEAFEQTDSSTIRRFGGSGLGLAVTRQLVDLHAGEIRLNSTVDKGSVFSVSLPLAGDIASEAPGLNEINSTSNDDQNGLVENLEPIQYQADSKQVNTYTPSRSTNQTSNVHILVVDDEPVNRQVLLNLLTIKHYEVSECADGIQALEFLQRSYTENKTINLVILDVMMPGMSGYEVCQRIRESKSNLELPVLFLTAKTQSDDLARGYEVGGNDYLTKPIEKKELFARVETQLQLLSTHRHLQDNVNTLKHTQSQLIQAEKMSSLGTLIGGLAHAMNNPINMSQVGTHNIEKTLTKFRKTLIELSEESADTAITEYFDAQFNRLFSQLSALKEGNSRVAQLAQSFSLFSQAEKETFRQTNIGASIDACITLVEAKYQGKIRFNYTVKQNPTIYAQTAQLNQVFINVLINACQAVQDKQNTATNSEDINNIEDLQVHDRCVETSENPINLTLDANGKHLSIIIKDTGSGMSDDTLKQVFDPFFTTRGLGEGNGLGLATAYSIIDHHQGLIEISSQLNHGTTVTILLPLQEDKE